MRFWDASAIVPLVVDEDGSTRARTLVSLDPEQIVWWGAVLECTSALARREREGVPTTTIAALVRRLRSLAARWMEVPPSEAVRRDALRLLRAHRLAAGDALQLAAARAACSGDPGDFPFVCADRRLGDAALREGFDVIDPLAAE